MLKLPVCGFEGPKTTSIDVEYEMQLSHISLLVPDRSCTFPANKLVYKTHPSNNTTNKIPV